MAVARPDREAEPPVKLRRRVEIADGMDDVIETAGHQASKFNARQSCCVIVLHEWSQERSGTTPST